MYKADYSQWLKEKKDIVLAIVKSSGKNNRGLKGVISILKHCNFGIGTKWIKQFCIFRDLWGHLLSFIMSLTNVFSMRRNIYLLLKISIHGYTTIS